jgi:hypothetical protein
LRASSWASSSPRPTARISGERAAGDVVLRLGVQDHTLALGERRHARVEHARRRGDGDRDVGLGVAQGQEGEPRAGAPGELGDLALEPHRAEAGDVALERHRDRADGGRTLR